jgi:hypothetical protein
MPDNNDTGLDFESLKKLAQDHDASVRLRTRDGRIIDITSATLPADIVAAGKVSVDNHDRVGVRVGDHDRITNIHDRAGRTLEGLSDPLHTNVGATDGVFLSGLDERQIAELRSKASDLLRGKEITVFKNK